MVYIEYSFTSSIIDVLNRNFPNKAEEVISLSELIQYLNIKTKAANKNSKSRGSFANLYAIYVLVEDYIKKGFHKSGSYNQYQGAQFNSLFKRQRALPFGSRLQNHALNHRLNEEFKKYFPESQFLPILRDIKTNRYWINENLLVIKTTNGNINIAEAVIEIINIYIEVRKKEFKEFMEYCEEIIRIQKEDPGKLVSFVSGLLRPDVDARIFEIVSYAILKNHYAGQKIYWGWDVEDINEEQLMLFKTGRTNANDGGIDFVMRPLGRFFQVTEMIDSDKYFLDIDKVQRYPITFVIKSELSVDEIISKVKVQAQKRYSINEIVKCYMQAIEEVINIPMLLEILNDLLQEGKGGLVINEILIQSKLEFDLNET
ncbi:MAG: restriction endonuclease [Candidatus Cloacimonas sp.]